MPSQSVTRGRPAMLIGSIGATFDIVVDSQSLGRLKQPVWPPARDLVRVLRTQAQAIPPPRARARSRRVRDPPHAGAVAWPGGRTRGTPPGCAAARVARRRAHRHKAHLGLISRLGLSQDILRDLLKGAVDLRTGVASDPGAVDRHLPRPHQPSPVTQHEHLAKQVSQRLLVTADEPRDRRVDRNQVARDHPVGPILAAVALDRPRGPHVDRKRIPARFRSRPGRQTKLIWRDVCQPGVVDFSRLRCLGRRCGRLGGWRSGRLCATRGQTDIRGLGPQDHGSSWGAAV